MHRKFWCVLGVLSIVLLSACAQQQASQVSPSRPLLSDGLHLGQQPDPTPPLAVTFPRQLAPTATPTPKPPPAPPPPQQNYPPVAPPTTIPDSGSGAAPYGQPSPVTAEESQLTKHLFALINSDRAARGLYPYVWDATLAGGARLHAWNMEHCGFSHSCPDGRSPCQRISAEGFTYGVTNGYFDCGECIALAGPYPTAWDGVSSIQESMINEPPTGWHRIYLTSTSLHKVGVGIYVDSKGWIWITEDLVG